MALTNPRFLPIVPVLALALAVPAQAGGATMTKPGWTLAKASAYIEFNLRLSDPELVSQAAEHLRIARQVGGPRGIAAAERDLRTAKAGYSVGRASCLGMRRAPGGYVSFKCKLSGNIDLGFTLKSVGVWKRRLTGKWRYVESSRSYGGYGPSWWNN
jgi:hypothetical protein